MKKSFLILLVMSVFSVLHAENDSVYKARIQQKIAELEFDGLLSLWITDCDTGKPVQEATVDISNVGAFKTDNNGIASFPALADGIYDFAIIHDEYVPTTEKFEVFGESIFFYKYSVPKKVDYKCIKIIPDWGKTPKDLDAHLIKENSYHISFRDKRKSDDKTVWLDKDDMDSFGPETITITELDTNSTYKYFVFNWTNRNDSNSLSLSKSGAKVRIYADNKFLQTFKISSQKQGIKWDVFNIEQGKFIPVNEIE